MSYSLDLRERVVGYVKEGGKKTDAAKQFKVSVWCVNDWCKRKNLEPNVSPGRRRKFSWEALREDVRKYPDKLLKERADAFGVHINAIWYACQQMKITDKKNL